MNNLIIVIIKCVLFCQGEYKGLTEIDCHDCPDLEEIPDMRSEFANIPGLQYLKCSGCFNLKKISDIRGLLYLSCFECPQLKNIPNIRELQYLDCRNCHQLKEIPDIRELQYLDCGNCHQLKEIPNFRKLQYLDCENCYELKEIPDAIDMINLNCKNCKLILEVPNTHGELYTTGCKWYYRTSKMIDKIKILQRLQKKRIFIRRLKITKELRSIFPSDIVNIINYY